MERFVKQHKGHIVGILSGFDRVLFRGTLRSLNYREGICGLLWAKGVTYAQYGCFVQQASAAVRTRAEQMAEELGRPFLYLNSPRVKKQELAESICQRDQVAEGLICVLATTEPCSTWSLRRNQEGGRPGLVRERRKCLYLYFYFLDAEFGLMHVKLQTWMPFDIEVAINGRTWLSKRMKRTGMDFEQKGNTFTQLGRAEQAQSWMDRLAKRMWGGWLSALARRVNPWLDKRHGWNLHGYYWTVRQSEYATDVMFDSAETVQRLYPQLVRHAIDRFESEDVLRFLGRRDGRWFRGETRTMMQRRGEGIRVKHWVDENSIKMYNKAGSVLRIETTMNNPRRFQSRRRVIRNGKRLRAWVPLRKGLADLSRRVQICRAANRRYLRALAVVTTPDPAQRVLDPVSHPVFDAAQRRYRSLRPVAPDDAARLALLQNGASLLHGFRNADLQPHWRTLPGNSALARPQLSARITRWLAITRAHGLLYRVPGTHAYRLTDKGSAVVTLSGAVRSANLTVLAA